MIGENNNYKLYKQKAKLQTGIGCFFSVAIIGLIIIIIPIWFLLSYSDETLLKVSHSPNNINTIEIVKKEDFPDPTIRIKYDDQNIMKTKIPDTVSVEWDNDYEAEVILTSHGKTPSVVKVNFN